ncbi:MAG TPA: hypothetical protein VFD38_01270 [Myxococcaceae bacterium]|nr:hypothetical protein [Myxococcaceae bacterium]
MDGLDDGRVHPRILPDVEEPCSVWLVVPQANCRIASVCALSEAIAAAFRRGRRIEPDEAPRRRAGKVPRR